jgi:hypothetical protein
MSNAEATSNVEIGCKCGAIRVELAGVPVAQFYCHCDDCQAVHGAGYVAVAMYRAESVKVTQGTPTVWKLKVTPRTTCPECGTRLFAEHPGFPMRGVNALLLPPGTFKPEFHVQCQFAAVPLIDELPHYESLPAVFGGTDETVDW